MKIGLCVDPVTFGTLPETAQVAYIEGHVQSFLVPEAPDAEFAPRLTALRQCSRKMPVSNSLFPPDLKLTGPHVNVTRLDRYLATALRRAGEAGMEFVVFGSGAARTAPPHFSRTNAFEQLVGLLRRSAPVAARHGITLLVEPLQRGECNVINTLREGVDLVRRVDEPAVKLLVDIFHMLRNREDPNDILAAGPLIRHAHIAEDQSRAAPGVQGQDFGPYLRALRRIDYRARLSIEAVWEDLPRQLGPAVSSLQTQMRAAGY
jgi:sugar phosphate isomerase/epimerase